MEKDKQDRFEDDQRRPDHSTRRPWRHKQNKNHRRMAQAAKDADIVSESVRKIPSLREECLGN